MGQECLGDAGRRCSVRGVLGELLCLALKPSPLNVLSNIRPRNRTSAPWESDDAPCHELVLLTLLFLCHQGGHAKIQLRMDSYFVPESKTSD